MLPLLRLLSRGIYFHNQYLHVFDNIIYFPVILHVCLKYFGFKGGGGMSTNIEEIFETEQQYADQQHADNVSAEKKHTELERQWKIQQRER